MRKKKTLITIGCLIIILLLSFGIRKIYLNIHEENIKDIDWLRDNISIEENKEIGNDIYYVNKNNDIDIYNDNYRTVINEKLEEINDGDYSFENPLMIYNLYGTNLLSLNVYFDTDEASSLDYTISIDNEDIDDFSRTLKNNGEDNLTTNHEYQIIGFVPGYTNTLKLTLKKKK